MSALRSGEAKIQSASVAGDFLRDHAISMRNIVKKFPGVTANAGIDFDVKTGEIHALLGENGAGKTTLMNILYGLYRPDDGEVYIKGERTSFASPTDAINLGIAMVHQHFTLVNSFTVAQNIILGMKNSGLFLDVKEAEKKVAEVSEKYGLKVDPEAKIWQLSVGERQRVEVLRALYRGADILILDEPTSVLTPPEVKDLFAALRSMVQSGKSIIFITHKLREVMMVSNRVTVLRDGKVTGNVETATTNETELARMMIGRELKPLTNNVTSSAKEAVRIQSLDVMSDKGYLAVKQLNLSIGKGQIVGIAGVAGNGQRELADAIAGLRLVNSGSLLIDNEDLTNKSPRQLISHGLAYIPEDRLKVGVLLDLSVSDNLILEQHADKPFADRFMISHAEVTQYTEKLMRDYSIKASSPKALAKTLSGGNLQKLILARELSRNPTFILAANPTKGLDVGATEYVRSKLLEAKSNGAAVLLISEDLDEVLELSDQVAVMYEGKIMGIFNRSELDVKKIGLMMGGVQAS
jgi:simple sugar transport system ATP-binding protein